MPSRLSPAGFKPLADTSLFTPIQIGALKLEHRIIQAPLTRMRGVKESDGVFSCGDIMVDYYSQRANKGGLQITEATNISRMASGYPGIPGIFTEGQSTAWKRVTDAVHAKGGFIYCQIWHVGRATVPSFLDGNSTVSSSDIPLKGNGLDGSEFAAAPPRPMTVEEIHAVTNDFAEAAKRCIEAGFDGVEIHAANGYLLEQFLHDNVNKRTDAYGGSVENRCRFPLEVIKAVTSAVGADRVGIRLSPYNYYQDTRDSNPNAHWAYLCNQIAELPTVNRVSYVHMIEPRFDEELDEQGKLDALASYSTKAVDGVEPEVVAKAGVNSLVPFQRILAKGGVKFLAAGNFNRDNVEAKVASGDADAIVMGRWFIANPDLPKRLAEGLSLNDYDRSTFYGADPPTKGYTDYPFYKAKVHADASDFALGITKEEVYKQVLEQAEALFQDQRNWVCNLANTASLLWHAYKALPSPSSDVNWAGFYVLDPASPPQTQRLILGPFQGKVACQTILFSRGVCGAAAATQTTQLVPDVDAFPGHIACDGASRSEIVVPIIVEGKTVGIIDVDCAVKDGFDGNDAKYLEELAGLIARSCDW